MLSFDDRPTWSVRAEERAEAFNCSVAAAGTLSRLRWSVTRLESELESLRRELKGIATNGMLDTILHAMHRHLAEALAKKMAENDAWLNSHVHEVAHILFNAFSSEYPDRQTLSLVSFLSHDIWGIHREVLEVLDKMNTQVRFFDSPYPTHGESTIEISTYWDAPLRHTVAHRFSRGGWK